MSEYSHKEKVVIVISKVFMDNKSTWQSEQLASLTDSQNTGVNSGKYECVYCNRLLGDEKSSAWSFISAIK